jgi:hypothetical protein
MLLRVSSKGKRFSHERPFQLIKRPAAAAIGVVVAAGILAGQASPRPGTTLTDEHLFDDSALQRIELQVNERDWNALRENFTLNTYYPATLLWKGETARNVGIRSRGSGTRSGTKPGILVDFDRYVTGGRFLGLAALVLDNHLQDPSAMREAVTMAVHAKVGVPAPREAPAALYVNGAFLGIYTLVENLDEVAMGRLFSSQPGDGPTIPGRPRSATGVRREGRGVPPSPPAQAAVLRGAAPGAPPAALPTGFLFEYNWLDYFWGTYPGPELDLYAAMLEPETREDEPLETTHRPIEAMFREINESADDQFVERVGQHLDLQLLVKLAAVQNYLAEWDGVVGAWGLNNFYLYRPAGGGAHVIIPWDEDYTFYDPGWRIDQEFERNVLMRRAMAVPELRQLFIRTIDEVAAIVESRVAGDGLGWLENEIARRAELVRRLMREDRVKPFSNEDFENAVAYNLDFARRRPAIVRQQLQRFAASGSR